MSTKFPSGLISLTYTFVKLNPITIPSIGFPSLSKMSVKCNLSPYLNM